MTQNVAIVTGASRGIGAATAKLLGARGYAVCVNYTSSGAAAEALAASLPRAIAFQADIGRESDVLALFAAVDKKFGPVTALVNNAGVSGGPVDFDQMGYEDMEWIFSANVFGAMLCCREAVSRMKKHGGGAIVNVSSMAASFGGSRMTAYAASKAAVSTLTIGLAREVAPHGIRVNAVAPGIIATDQNSGIGGDKLATLPMKRMGTPEEVAEAICWLLSDAASYVSGSILPVAGAR